MGSERRDLIGGHVDASFSMVVPLVPHVEIGSLKIIAVTTSRRSPAVLAMKVPAPPISTSPTGPHCWRPREHRRRSSSKLAAAVGDPPEVSVCQDGGVWRGRRGGETVACPALGKPCRFVWG
jgi:hypothetical protein